MLFYHYKYKIKIRKIKIDLWFIKFYLFSIKKIKIFSNIYFQNG